MEKLLRMELTSKLYFSYKINPDLLVGCSRLMTVRTLYAAAQGRASRCSWVVRAVVEIRKTYVSLHGEFISRRLDIFSQYFPNLVTKTSLEFRN